MLAIGVALLVSLTISTQQSCSQAIPGCLSCSSDLLSCTQCWDGFFTSILGKLQVIIAQGPLITTCVSQCSTIRAHVNSIVSRSCELDCSTTCSGFICDSSKISCPQTPSPSACSGNSYLMNDGSCSLYGCPSGFYRKSATQSCDSCHNSCFQCSGPNSNECLACNQSHYLSLNNGATNMGTCNPKVQQNPSPSFSIFLSNDQNLLTNSSGLPLPHKGRDGSAQLPYLDLRDALIKAHQISASSLTSNVTIYLTKGVHFIPLESETQRYQPVGAAYDDSNPSFNLTINPLPCDHNFGSSNPIFVLANVCVQPQETVELRVKIGAFFHIPVSASLSMERVNLDFSDSLVEWGSSCHYQRSASCKVTLNADSDTYTMTPLAPSCQCHSPLTNVSTCNYNHPLALIDASPSSQESNKEKKVILSDSSFMNIFSSYNSLVGYESSSSLPLQLSVQGSNFQHISICGSLVSSYSMIPTNGTYSPSATQNIMTHPSTPSISSTSAPFINIMMSNFSQFGLALQYDTSRGPELFQSIYNSSTFSRRATVLNLDNFPGEITVRGCHFSKHKLYHFFNHTYDPMAVNQIQGNILSRQMGLIKQAVLMVTNSAQGITLIGNTFEFISTLQGAVFLEMPSQYSKGALILENSFYSCVSRYQSAALTLRASYNSAHSQSCSGFFLKSNIFAHGSIFSTEAALVSLTCLLGQIPQLDSMDSLSFTEISAYEAASGSISLSIPVPPANTHTYQDSLGQSISVDFASVSLLNSTFTSNFVREGEGNLLSVIYMPNLLFSGISLYRNGDFKIINSFTNTTEFWRDYSGLHLSTLAQSPLLTLTTLNSLYSTSTRNDSQILFYGTQTLSLSNLDIISPQSSETTSVRPLLLEVEDVSSLTLENVSISSIHTYYEPTLIQDNLNRSNLISRESSLSNSWNTSHLYNRPMLQTGATTLTCLNCTFQNATTEAQFLTLTKPPNTFSFLNSQVTNLHSLPFVSSPSELSLLNVSNSHFTHFTLSKAFPSTRSLQISSSSINNANYALPTTPASHCTLVGGYQSGTIANSSFTSLGGLSKCSGDLLTTRTKVTLSIQDSQFVLIVYEGWANSTSPGYRFLSFTGSSSVNITGCLFQRNQVGFTQPLIESYESTLNVNNSQFKTNLGIIFNIEYQSFTLNNSYVFSNFAHANNFIFYIQRTQNVYIHHTTFFYNYGGNALVYLVASIGARHPEPWQINPISDYPAYPDFYNVTFRDNMHNFLVLLRSDSFLFMSNITYKGNINYGYRNLPIYALFAEIVLYHSTFFPAYPNACYFADQYPALIVEGSNAHMKNISFSSFCAQRGLLYLAGTNYAQLEQLKFTNVFGLADGKLINFQTGATSLKIINSTFTNIQPRIIVSTSGKIQVSDSTFTNIYHQLFSSRESLSVLRCTFNSVNAPSYELIQCIECGNLNLTLNSFSSIRGKHLVKLSNIIDNSSPLSTHHYTVRNSTFQNINITDSGVFFFQELLAKQVLVYGNQFKSINALQATQANGVLSFQYSDLQSTVAISHNEFNDCHAHVGGGIFYSDREPVRSHNTFTNVDATLYGDEVASYPMKMVIIDSNQASQIRDHNYKGAVNGMSNTHAIQQMRSGGEIGEHYLALLDKLNQTVRTVQGDYIYTAITHRNSSLTSNFSEILTLVNTKEWNKGVLHISNISFIGHPGFHYQLQMSGSSVHLDPNKYDASYFTASGHNPSVLFDLNLRTCQRGERFHNTGECQACEEGSYLLQAVTQPTSCEKCPSYAKCFGGDQIGPSEGYWRAGSHSLKFLPCFNFQACRGSLQDYYQPEGTCEGNYEGILCSQCKAGYTRNSQFECSQCPSVGVNIALLFILLILVIFFFIFVISCTLNSMTKQKSIFSVYFLLTINHLQILMLISSFRFDWPANVQTFFRFAHAVSDPPRELFSLDCLFQEMNSSLARFYVYLIIYCILPSVGVLLTLLFCWIKVPRNVLCDKFIGSSLIFIFLVHPAVSHVLFQSLNCYAIEGSNRLLQQMSEVCWQGTHLQFSIGLSLPGVLFWVIALPLFTFLHLRDRKPYLDNSKTKSRLGFLYNGFQKRSYFWQVLTLSKKDAIAFIGVFLIRWGTEIQSYVLFFVLLCLGFFTFRVMPWKKLRLNHLELHSHLALIITVFSGLIFLSSSDPSTPYFQTGKDFSLKEYSRWILFTVILVANFSFFINIVWNVIGETRSSMRRKCPRFYICCCLGGDQQLLKEEKQEEKTKNTFAKILEEIQTIQSTYAEIKQKYIKGEPFADQDIFQRLLHHHVQDIKKVNLFAEKALIGRKPYRESQSMTMLVKPETKEQDLKVDQGFMDNSQDVLVQFEQSPTNKKKSSKNSIPLKKVFKDPFSPSNKNDSTNLSHSISDDRASMRFQIGSNVGDELQVIAQKIVHTTESMDVEYQVQGQLSGSPETLMKQKSSKVVGSSMSLRRSNNRDFYVSRRLSKLEEIKIPGDDELFEEIENVLSPNHELPVIKEEEIKERRGDYKAQPRASQRIPYASLRKDRKSIYRNPHFDPRYQDDCVSQLNISYSVFSHKIKNRQKKKQKKKQQNKIHPFNQHLEVIPKNSLTLDLNRI